MLAAAKNPELVLIDEIEKYVFDPLGFVLFAYPWMEPGPLESEDGPDKWQTDVLAEIGRQLQDPTARPTPHGPIQVSGRSGHGVGKTALFAWLIQWFCSTRPHPQIPVTANTKDQLSTKTWRELAKWHKLLINAHWFRWTATKFAHVAYPETWFAHAIPWSVNRPESFAGTHETHVMMLFDEASAIEDVIWETAEGAMTTADAIWIVFGNPTRNSGRFYQCFNKFRHRWTRFEIDSRNAKKADQIKIQQWIDDYGEDSDFVRVRVRGVEPRAGMTQLIPTALIDEAMARQITKDSYSFAPRVLGVDVARFGDDQSVILRRQGLKVFDGIKKFRGLDTMQLASRVSKEIQDWKPHAVFVDVVGIGAGVVDRLRQLHHQNIIEVNNANSAMDDKKYFNKRAECWDRMKAWLKAGGSLPNDNEVRDDLGGPEYGFDGRERLQIESKDDMKERGLASPDVGDALAMTFAEHVEIAADEPEDIEPPPIGYYTYGNRD